MIRADAPWTVAYQVNRLEYKGVQVWSIKSDSPPPRWLSKEQLAAIKTTLRDDSVEAD